VFELDGQAAERSDSSCQKGRLIVAPLGESLRVKGHWNQCRAEPFGWKNLRHRRGKSDGQECLFLVLKALDAVAQQASVGS
jgi:hypothetical protein